MLSAYIIYCISSIEHSIIYAMNWDVCTVACCAAVYYKKYTSFIIIIIIFVCVHVFVCACVGVCVCSFPGHIYYKYCMHSINAI